MNSMPCSALLHIAFQLLLTSVNFHS